MYLFTSDTHFGCEEILKRENRPFKSIKDFETSIFQIWNSQVKPNDIIYHLGDFVNYNKNNKAEWEKTLKLVQRSNAKIILIIGNNEQRIIDECCDKNFDTFRQICLDSGFYDVKKEEYLKINDNQFYLNHYPRNYKDGYINLFGHTHRATGLWKPFGLNVGCDLNHFYLYSQDEIERLLDCKDKYWDNDIDNLTF